MQYTIRQVPKKVDKALRAKAKAEKKSLNQVALEALAQGVGVGADVPMPARDLRFMTGDWTDEDEQVLRQTREIFEQIDPESWR